ncbi:MAG: sugar phosphate isomerase/epimerase [Nitrospinae bacterium]|nr:sugar phosphate isomerase/epimerase [Nitrospinota bacterium]
MENSPLKKFEGRFDRLGFRLGAPSWVWPGTYSENARMLKPLFREVQITAYEPHSVSPVTAEELDSLDALNSAQFGYSLHLPIPTGLSAPGGSPELPIVETIKAFRKVGVGNHVLHIEKPGRGWDPVLVRERVARIIESSALRPEQVCVENIISTRFEEVWPAVAGLGVSVCFDVGHCVARGEDPMRFFDDYSGKIRMAHIHGATRGRDDHLALGALGLETLSGIVARFAGLGMAGAVIIENFSAETLLESLEDLSQIS